MTTIGDVPVQARAAGNHRSRPSHVPAHAGASRAGYHVAMETRSQAALVGPGVPAQTGASRSCGHTTMEARNLVGPRMPAQAGASRSGCCTTLGAGDGAAMQTSSCWTHHLAVAQTGATRGSQAGVDGPAAKARTGGGVGAHCPVACLRAPRHRVDAGHSELRPRLAFRGAKLLKGVVRAAVAAARRRERRRALVVSLSRRAGLAQAAGTKA